MTHWFQDGCLVLSFEILFLQRRPLPLSLIGQRTVTVVMTLWWTARPLMMSLASCLLNRPLHCGNRKVRLDVIQLQLPDADIINLMSSVRHHLWHHLCISQVWTAPQGLLLPSALLHLPPSPLLLPRLSRPLVTDTAAAFLIITIVPSSTAPIRSISPPPTAERRTPPTSRRSLETVSQSNMFVLRVALWWDDYPDCRWTCWAWLSLTWPSLTWLNLTWQTGRIIVFQPDRKQKTEHTPVYLLSVEHLQHGGLLISAEHTHTKVQSEKLYTVCRHDCMHMQINTTVRLIMILIIIR